MTDTTASTPADDAPAKKAAAKRGGGLNTMLLADLKSLAGGLGISDAATMKKAQLVAAIKAQQAGGSGGSGGAAAATGARAEGGGEAAAPAGEPTAGEGAGTPEGGRPARTQRSRRNARAEEPATAADSSGGSDGGGSDAGQVSSSAPTTETESGAARADRGGRTARGDRDRGDARSAGGDAAGDRSSRADDRSGGAEAGDGAGAGADGGQPRSPRSTRQRQRGDGDQRQRRQQDGGQQTDRQQDGRQQDDQQRDQRQQQRDQRQGQSQDQRQEQRQDQRQDQRQAAQAQAQATQSQSQSQGPDQNDDDDDGEGGRRNRRRRGRDRERTGRTQRNEPDTTVLDDDVLVPAAGILDVLDNYAFVRTSGYLPGSEDVYVSLSMVRKYGLRRGDAVVGQVRQPREGERREKFNPMVRIDSVNGADPEAAKHRPEFAKLTPVHPSERLRLETAPDDLVGRVIDLVAPVGKGQRGLIVSPGRAGKTQTLQSVAASLTRNNPEVHLMVVLIDERPEEVTDFQRSVKGEVVSSTFDRPAGDHTTAAELAIERAKRLVELGHDVVVLLDGITRLGRAYNLSVPASGRVLPGGIDSAALYPTKRFFGAARNIEDGGSLTILATAVVESGAEMDEVIFTEFEGTGNMELRLSRDLAEQGVFPAVDAAHSGTRREDLLLTPEELAVTAEVRRRLAALGPRAGLEGLLEELRSTQTNLEHLLRVRKGAGAPAGRVN